MVWVKLFCFTCGINEEPPHAVNSAKSAISQGALAQGTGTSTSTCALETGGTEVAAATAPVAAPTPTPPYVRRHQRTITLDGSEGSFISVGVGAPDLMGAGAGDPYDRARSDGGGAAGSPVHAAAAAAAATHASSLASASHARMARHSYSPAMAAGGFHGGHGGHRRGTGTAGGGFGASGGTSSPPLWARRPGSAKALVYGSAGGGAPAMAHSPAVPSRFSLNGCAPASHSAYGGSTVATAAAPHCSSISTSMYGGVGYGGYGGSRTTGGAVADVASGPPHQQPQLQRPSAGGRLHRRYMAPPCAGSTAVATAAASATAASACAAARPGPDDLSSGSDDSAQPAGATASGSSSSSAALQQAAEAAACRRLAAAQAAAQAAAASAAASTAAKAVAAVPMGMAAAVETGDEADKEDGSSFDSAATVVLVEAEAATADDGPLELGPSTLKTPWGPNVSQRTLLPSQPHHLLPPLAPRSPGGISEAFAAPSYASARPWRSSYEPAAAASSAPASASGMQPLSELGRGGMEQSPTVQAVPPPRAGTNAAPSAVTVTTVDCRSEDQTDATAAIQLQLQQLLEKKQQQSSSEEVQEQQCPPPPPFAPSSSKLLFKEACPPRRTTTGSSLGSCNNSISLRVDHAVAAGSSSGFGGCSGFGGFNGL